MGRKRIAYLHLVSKLWAAQTCSQSHGKAFHSRHLHNIRNARVHTSIKFLFTHTQESFDQFLLGTAHHLHSRICDFKCMRTCATHANASNGNLPACETGAENACASKDALASFNEKCDASSLPTMCKATQSAAGDEFVFVNEALDDDSCRVHEADAAEKEESKDIDIMFIGELAKSETAMSIYKILQEEGWSSPDTEKKLSNVVRRVTPTLVVEVVRLLKNGKVALSFLNWAKDQEGYEPQAEAYTHLIARFGRERDFNSAWCLLVEMKCNKLAIDYAFSIFIHRLKRAKRAQGLVKAMCGMTFLGVTPTIALYTSAMEFLLKVDHGDEATHLYKQMLQGGLVPDKKLYELMIVGYSKVGKVDESLLLFNEMQCRGYAPHVSVYSALISSLSVANKVDKGSELFKEMIKIGPLPREFEVDEIACALHGKDTMEMIDKFLKVVDRMAFRWRIHSHNNLLQCLLDTGRCDEAMEIFARIPHGQNVRAPPRKDPAKCYWNLNSYRIVILGLCKLGQFDHALEMFKELLERDLKPTDDISSFLLLSLSNAGRIDKALSFCKHITGTREAVSIDAQHCFFTALRTSGHLSVALKIFASMKRKGCIDQGSDFVSLIGLESQDEEVSYCD